VDTIYAVEQIRQMRGGAQSHLMRCEDGDYYVVKFQNNPQHRRILVDEMLGTRLASILGLPTTAICVLYVSEELIGLTPDLCIELSRQRIPCQPGPQFGSRFPGDPHRLAPFDFLPDPLLMSVENLHDFAGMLVFDKWTCNTNGRQTLFYRKEAEKPQEAGASYCTVMIDQGFCFNAGEWNFPDAPLRGLYARNNVYRGVRGEESFAPWMERLEASEREDTGLHAGTDSFRLVRRRSGCVARFVRKVVRPAEAGSGIDLVGKEHDEASFPKLDLSMTSDSITPLREPILATTCCGIAAIWCATSGPISEHCCLTLAAESCAFGSSRGRRNFRGSGGYIP
jgi:hypothetical protein